MRAKAETEAENLIKDKKTLEKRLLDLSKHRSKNLPSLTWRECIKKIWKEDPLICPECQREMRIISFITEVIPIEKILRYLDLWDEVSSRDPPVFIEEIVYTPIDDGWHQEMDDLVS